MKALTEKLRLYPRGHQKMSIEDIDRIADEIEAELAERYVALPLDADGFRDLKLGRELVRCSECSRSAETACYDKLLMCCWWARPTERDGFCHEGRKRG